MHKRRWLITPKHLQGKAITFRDRTLDALSLALREKLEIHLSSQSAPMTRAEVIALAVNDPLIVAMAEVYAPTAAPSSAITQLLEAEEIPFLADLRLRESGLKKRREWEHTWELQRAEDAGKSGLDIPVPPKYTKGDYSRASYWDLRGPLDAPKERFISYPHCASRESPSPLYGHAGWNHEQRARALATLYWSRKTEEGWLVPKPDDPPNTPDLTPMLAGLLELLPWLHQWHSAPSDDYGGDSPGSYFSAFLEGECQELGLTHDDLRAWRPPAKTRGRAKAPKTPKPPKPKTDKPKRTPKPKADDTPTDASTPAKPPRKPRRPKAKPTAPEPEPTPPATAEPAFTLTPPPSSEDTWKTTKKKSKKSSTNPTPSLRRRKLSDPA